MLDRKEMLITSEIRKLVPVLGKDDADRLNRAYLIGDEDTRKRIFELVDVIKAAVYSDKAMQGSILMEPVPAEHANTGDIKLGTVLYGSKTMYPYSIDRNSLLTHIGIFGSSGYGKTNISYWIIEKLSEAGIPVVIFDFSKRNYRDLLATKLRKNIDIFTVGRTTVPFKFNPLKPPDGISQSQWIKEFSLIFDHSYWLMGGGRHIIMKALDAVYKAKKNPKLSDLKEYLHHYASDRMPAREKNWIATAARPLDSLCFKELGQVFEADTGVQPSEFFKEGKITILELDALSTNDKTFVIEIILQWVRDWLLQGSKREELKGVVILEEAHHILNREKSSKLGSETVMDLVFREVRELGIGIVYTDQHPSMISYPALGNTSTHIYMNLGLDTMHSSDIRDAASMLGLDHDDEKNHLRKLPIGNGFMLRRNSGFPNPFIINFDRYDLKKGLVRDEHLKKIMEGRVGMLYEEKKEAEIKEELEAPQAKEDIDVRELNGKEWEMIKAIGDGSGTFTSQIYKALSISGKVFNDRVRRLTDMGLVGSINGKIGKNRMNYYFLTPLGLDVFKKHIGIAPKEFNTDISSILELTSSVGWEYDAKNSRLVMDANGKKYWVSISLTTDRAKIGKDVRSCHYFICANDRVRNMVVQESASHCYSRGKGRIIFIALADKFGEKGRFDKVEIA